MFCFFFFACDGISQVLLFAAWPLLFPAHNVVVPMWMVLPSSLLAPTTAACRDCEQCEQRQCHNAGDKQCRVELLLLPSAFPLFHLLPLLWLPILLLQCRCRRCRWPNRLGLGTLGLLPKWITACCCGRAGGGSRWRRSRGCGSGDGRHRHRMLHNRMRLDNGVVWRKSGSRQIILIVRVEAVATALMVVIVLLLLLHIIVVVVVVAVPLHHRVQMLLTIGRPLCQCHRRIVVEI